MRCFRGHKAAFFVKSLAQMKIKLRGFLKFGVVTQMVIIGIIFVSFGEAKVIIWGGKERLNFCICNLIFKYLYRDMRPRVC